MIFYECLIVKITVSIWKLSLVKINKNIFFFFSCLEAYALAYWMQTQPPWWMLSSPPNWTTGTCCTFGWLWRPLWKLYLVQQTGALVLGRAHCTKQYSTFSWKLSLQSQVHFNTLSLSDSFKLPNGPRTSSPTPWSFKHFSRCITLHMRSSIKLSETIHISLVKHVHLWMIRA